MGNIINQVSALLGKLDFIPEMTMRLAFAGAVLLAVVFIVSLLFTLGSKIKKLTKKLLAANIGLSALERVDEDNVDLVYGQLTKLPETTADGWGRFMEQRIGYPSDYIREKSVLEENAYTVKNTVGRLLFRFFGILVLAAVAVAAVFLFAEDGANIGLKDFFDNFKVVGGIIGSVAIPIVFYAAFSIIISYIYRRQRKRMEMVFRSFQDTLDEKVVIYCCKEPEFESDTLEDLTDSIDGIIAQSISDDNLISVVSAPELEQAEEAAPSQAQELEPEPVQAEQEYDVVASEPMAKEEQARYLAVLISIVNNAISDVDVSTEELEQIAELIYGATGSFEDPADVQILDECMQKLADSFYAK